MKTYLELIPLSEKVHSRQNRMTRLCISISVFLVTAIFSLADMMFRIETNRMLQKHGTAVIKSFFERPSVQATFPILAVLFLLILLAGFFMIAGSMNSSISQRTRYFGILRCIGMSKAQVMQMVYLEALNWCKTAIPTGLFLGTVTSWILCAGLKYIVKDEYREVPQLQISWIAIGFGILIGGITVLIAAGRPARNAAGISPISAVRSETEKTSTGLFHIGATKKIETALGISHAVHSRKNLFLVSGSFGLSIVLFLSFTVFISLINYLMPQTSGDGQLEIRSKVKGNTLDAALIEKISTVHGVKRAFGRQSQLDMPAFSKDAPTVQTVDLISFDTFEMKNLKKDKLLQKGSDVSKALQNRDYAFLISDDPLPNDSIFTINGKDLRIAGRLKYNIFDEDGLCHGTTTLIISHEAFSEITGIQDYQLITVQLNAEAADEDVRTIDALLDDSCLLSDNRGSNNRGAYLAFISCAYAFLAVIALVAVMNIVNCISMEISAKIRQFGMMRAVGMDEGQLSRMIRAEAVTYGCSGCAAGLAIGLPLQRWIYGILIASHFTYAPAWSVPIPELLVILIFIGTAVLFGTTIPMKQIHKRTITETLCEQ